MYLPTSWIRSIAGWVKTISSPGLSASGSPPGCSPMKLSPSRPLVKMPADVSAGSPAKRLSMARVTTESNFTGSRSILSTRPTTTPPILTGACRRSWPRLEKRAVSG